MISISYTDCLLRLITDANAAKALDSEFVILGITCRIGFNLAPLAQLELTEGKEMLEGRKTVPEPIRSAIRRGWIASGLPPMFANKRLTTGNLELQDGHRRWLAARERGLSLVPLLWIDADSFQALMGRGYDRLEIRDMVFGVLDFPVPEK